MESNVLNYRTCLVAKEGEIKTKKCENGLDKYENKILKY